MYRSHYNLRERPFEISTDTRFLWMGEKHKEALAMLKYGVLARKGFLLLTGDVQELRQLVHTEPAHRLRRPTSGWRCRSSF